MRVAGIAVAVLIVVLAVYSFASTSRSARRHEERMRDAGIHGTGRITFVEDVSEKDSIYKERRLHLDITLADGQQYEGFIYLHLKGAREPTIGDMVRVKAHPDRVKELALLEAPFQS